MELTNIKWNKKTYKKYIEYLKSLGDLKYKEFHSKIANTKLEIMGICTPILKDIAKKISKSNVEEYFKLVENNYYEEVMIYGLVLSNSDYLDKHLNDFVSRIDNWAICDTFVSSLKIINKKQGKYWIYTNSLIDLKNEFRTRVSLVIMLNYYLTDDYIDRVLLIISNIKTDYYYVNMAISWLLSVAIINYPDKVIDLFKQYKLNKFVQNKAISKIQDSFRIKKEIKNIVKKYRIN